MHAQCIVWSVYWVAWYTHHGWDEVSLLLADFTVVSSLTLEETVTRWLTSKGSHLTCCVARESPRLHDGKTK